MTPSNAVVDFGNSTTVHEIQEAVQYNRMICMARHLCAIKTDDNKFLVDWLNQMIRLKSGSQILPEFSLPLHRRGQISTIGDICSVLRTRGEYSLADRIAYFASDEDLEAEDVPLTLESARGFLAFFSAVKSESRVSLTCSPEGWLCALWRFPDERRASLWFLNDNHVMFSAIDAAEKFIELDSGAEVGSLVEVMAKLVQAGLFTWHLNTLPGKNFLTTTMWRDIAESEILPKTEHQQMMRFYSGSILESVTSPQTGLSVFIHQTGNSRSTTSFNPYEPKGATLMTTHP